MPIYLFRNHLGEIRRLRTSMRQIAKVSADLQRRGWERVWTAPHLIIIPSYYDFEHEDAKEEERWQKRRRKELREIISEFKPEDKEIILDGEI